MVRFFDVIIDSVPRFNLCGIFTDELIPKIICLEIMQKFLLVTCFFMAVVH